MESIIKEEADKYQEFFNFMVQEHDLTLTISQMDDILHEAKKLKKKLQKPKKDCTTCKYGNESISSMPCKKCDGSFSLYEPEDSITPNKQN